MSLGHVHALNVSFHALPLSVTSHVTHSTNAWEPLNRGVVLAGQEQKADVPRRTAPGGQGAGTHVPSLLALLVLWKTVPAGQAHVLPATHTPPDTPTSAQDLHVCMLVVGFVHRRRPAGQVQAPEDVIVAFGGQVSCAMGVHTLVFPVRTSAVVFEGQTHWDMRASNTAPPRIPKASQLKQASSCPFGRNLGASPCVHVQFGTGAAGLAGALLCGQTKRSHLSNTPLMLLTGVKPMLQEQARVTLLKVELPGHAATEALGVGVTLAVPLVPLPPPPVPGPVAGTQEKDAEFS